MKSYSKDFADSLVPGMWGSVQHSWICSCLTAPEYLQSSRIPQKKGDKCIEAAATKIYNLERDTEN